MSMVITSYTPTTGPITGGTECTITGTGLDVVTSVLVGDNEAELVSVAGDGTSVVFITPRGDAAALPGGSGSCRHRRRAAHVGQHREKPSAPLAGYAAGALCRRQSWRLHSNCAAALRLSELFAGGDYRRGRG